MSSDDGAELEVTVVAHPAELSSLRQRVADAAAALGASDDVIEDFRLVVSELATNVIRHDDAAVLTVAFRRSDKGWVLDVSNAEHLADLDSIPIPDPDVFDGRGLVIVQAVMDQVQLVEINGEQHIRCFKHAH